jgi:hypothetical protein
MPNYWLGVAGNRDRVRTDGTSTFWCLPIEAQLDDIVLFYFPRAVSFSDHGIFAEGVVTSVPSMKKLDNPCAGYGIRDHLGPLRHVNVAIKRRFRPALTTKDMKADLALSRANFMRRNFQGTTFRLDPTLYARVVALAVVKAQHHGAKAPRRRSIRQGREKTQRVVP